MTQQQVQQVPVSVADPELLQQLRHAADTMSTSAASRYAISRGVTPPTGDPDWELLTRFEADGSDGPLMWVLVTEPAES